jgi:hypothetical protein
MTFRGNSPRLFPGGNAKGAARRPSQFSTGVLYAPRATKLLAQSLLLLFPVNDGTALIDREEYAPAGADDVLANLPGRVRDIATLRGLGYKCVEIGRRFGITAQAVSATLARYHRQAGDFAERKQMLELSARAANVLTRIGVSKRADARGRDIFALLRRERNCGEKTIDEIRRWLERGDEEQNP